MLNQEFVEALRNNALDIIENIPKSELHSHAGRGGTIAYIEQWANVRITPPSAPFDSLDEMNQWLNNNVKCHCPGGGYLKRVEAAFAQAGKDHIKVLALSFAPDEIPTCGTMSDFMSTMNELRSRYATDTEFFPDLALGSSGGTDAELSQLDDIFSFNWFKGIDICNYADRYTLEDLKKVCRKARQYGLLIKAHVGEFGEADEVMRYAEELELDEIQHGIVAAKSPQIMRWLASHKIQLNVCPTSNVMLKNSASYKTHQIRKLFDNGVPVTINSDDLMIFNATVSQEYLNLFNADLMNAEELDYIRETGLTHHYQK